MTKRKKYIGKTLIIVSLLSIAANMAESANAATPKDVAKQVKDKHISPNDKIKQAACDALNNQSKPVNSGLSS